MKFALFLFGTISLSLSVARADITTDCDRCAREVWPRLKYPVISQPSSPEVEYCLGLGYATGRIGERDLAKASQWLERAARGNFAPAKTALGYHYEKGYGVQRDPQRAVALYREAAAAGNADGAFNLGRAYQDGTGVEANQEEAMKWFRVAAAQGNESAKKAISAFSRGATFRGGQDEFEQAKKLYLAKDYAGAARLFERAAAAGNPMAELQLGYQNEFGEGMPQNFNEAARWYAAAAEHGNAIAQRNLGSLYENGKGVPEDWVQAARWYRASAEQADPKGAFALGRCYEFGMGVPQDRSQAVAWFQKAGAGGNAQGVYFAHHLSDSTNFIGFRSEEEQAYVIANKLRFGLLFKEPVGELFRNSAQRNAYISQMRRDVDIQEARTMWNIRKSEYEDCVRNGGSPCVGPGPEPH
jgi:TPR repeat protein